MHYLVTGHTGFKGAWLTFLLKELGHQVSGISLPPRPSSIYANSNQNMLMSSEIFADIRDYESCYEFIKVAKPDVIIHLAAQPLVRRSYLETRMTYETNFNGTLNILEVSTSLAIDSTLIITTDKVYKDQNKKTGYTESDPLGGFDPYSNSKALSDLLAQSYMERHTDKNWGIARAGNVIGGGDDGDERLISDIYYSIESGSHLILRNPLAIRPWQYVLDCLYGYYLAVGHMKKVETPIWNFGPNEHFTVNDFIQVFNSKLGRPISVSKSRDFEFLKETDYLLLNSAKAHNELNWKPTFNFEQTIESTVEWYAESKRTNFTLATSRQVTKFLNLVS